MEMKVSIGILLGGLILSLPGKAEDIVKTGSGVPVRVAAAKIEKLSEIIGANSTVEPISFVNVKAKVTGNVETVMADLGDLIQPGQVLLNIDPILLLAAEKSGQAEMTKVSTELKNSRLMLERQTALFSQNLIAKVDLENARASLDSARYEYARCLEHLTTIRQNLKYATVSSPLAGVIKDRQVNPGELVQNGDLLFTVGRIDSIYVVANVAQEKLPRVHMGQEAEIVFDSFPHQVVPGYVGKIDPSTDPKTRTFPTYIKVKNPQLRFKPGLSAYARLKYPHHSLTIPSLAVIERGGEAIVFVVENSRAHIRPVKVRPGPLGKSEVIEGLREGEQVVYYGLKSLKDNDAVDVEKAGGKNYEG